MSEITETVPFPQDRTCPYHPPTAYAPFREHRPLSRVTLYDGREVWVVTGRDTARKLLSDKRLSSRRDHPHLPITTPRLAANVDRRPALLGVDDPEHGVQRRLVIPSFSVKRMAELRPRIQETVDRLLDAMVEQGPPAELVESFALPVPSMVICALLGVPYEDHDFFESASRRLLRGPLPEDSRQAADQLEDYFRTLVAHKRKHPGDGLLDDLVQQRLPGTGTGDSGLSAAEEREAVEELISLATILLVAGHETTANMISLGTYTLLQHPERLAELRADESLLPAVVEELLRYLSIADGMLRVATDDIDVDGTVIRADEGVIFSTSVINRDPDAFADPDTLDWQRSARHHVAFGFGIHQCLGQNLARAEMEIALGSLLRRLPGLRLAVPAEEVPFKPGDTIQGLTELPLTW
ncbi:cytochrome P450 [Streptomyces sp. HNM0574]|uniref:cytochrome P450 n=1 Tax=Streptomyces sp. HNM0574 TaxID=2714954 RepID=UPI00146EA65F|nr:cytochrome P450 [Streptomyces sp. HNM0574]NLU69499.1 cytochrome P450 [Streptomyces sp. HNM0574]